MTAPRPEDRRRFGRIHLYPPLAAHLGETRVEVLDIALAGARVASVARFAPGAKAELTFDWEGKSVTAVCRIIRCTVAQFARAPRDKSVYQTGLQMMEIDGRSDHIIRQMIAQYVMRALEEQRTNAAGLPPVGPLLDAQYSDRFRKCELVDGKWRRVETMNPDQPESGFTISTEVEMHYVNLLCEAYQVADEEGRELTRTLAQLSVTRGEGVPTRRYIP